MATLSEWLPNPKGTDTAHEWIELYNEGGGVSNLKGWSLKTSSGKKFVFGEFRMEPGTYAVLSRGTTKLTLKNADEALFLYNPEGTLVSKSTFMGTAREGESVNVLQEGYFFGTPTPGEENAARITANVMEASHPIGTPLREPLGFTDVATLAFGVAFAAACVTQFLVTRNENLSNLFFKRD